MTRIGEVEVSRFLLGSNPFSGFSHQGVERDRAMVRHYTTARIKEAFFDAERLGITGLVARTDFHVMRLLAEYRDEGGKLQWFAQPTAASWTTLPPGETWTTRSGASTSFMNWAWRRASPATT